MRYLLLASVLLFGCSQFTRLITAEGMEQIVSADVVITVDGNKMCSGATIGNSTVITAAHCVNSCGPTNSISVAFQDGAVQGTIGECSSEDDVATIVTDELLPALPVLLSEKEAKVGQLVWAVSNPVFKNGMTPCIVSFGVVAMIYDGKFVSTVLGAPGSSGGAVYNADGSLIGIIHGATVDTEEGSHFPVSVGLGRIKKVVGPGNE